MSEIAVGQQAKFQGRMGASILLTVMVAWTALEPWRPLLAGDDFGYYDSVVRTLMEGRVVVSDWLNPFAVGLTVPAAGIVKLVEDLWLGSMLTVALFGLIGISAFGRLLRDFGGSPTVATFGMLAWAFFPAWLAKWTHFESAVPAVSLMLVALLLYFRSERAHGYAAWLLLLAGGACAAWAVAIRQNHLVLVLVGAAGLLTTKRDYTILRLATWILFPAVVFLSLQYGMPKTFAQEHVMGWHLSQLTLGEYVARFVRGALFSVGCAFWLMCISNPSRVLARILAAPISRRWFGGASFVALLVSAFHSESAARWLAPQSDVLYLERFPWLLATMTCTGALLWPFFLPAPASTGKKSAGMLTAAAGYVALASLWGYWEYYFLEVILLIWLAGFVPTSRVPCDSWPKFQPVFSLVLLTALVGCSWYGQKVLIDLQAAQTRIAEQCFRDGLVLPFECRGAPFGLMGWNLFQHRVTGWPAHRRGNPLAFWEEHEGTAYFRWRQPRQEDSGLPLLREGMMQIGFRSVPWSLVRSGSAVADPAAGALHRLLSLDRREWQDQLLQVSSSAEVSDRR